MFKFYLNPRNPSFFRNFYTLLVIFVLALATTLPEGANANSKYAGIVIDAKTGETLYADQADTPRYPASLTKIMTLYIVFEELQSKRLHLDTRLRISKYAANQPPSKIGIRVGHPITVRTAIRALVTKSANDVATAVAENISGTESKFAARMTRTANSIGMKQTTFRNAHGLPNSKQRTTARDMAILGRAIQERFPNYYKYFSTQTFEFRGRTYSNHNRLLGRIKGVDGIKTGYINASGYNLVTSLKRDQRHIVAVVMGGRTGTSRNNHMIDLINRYLKKASTGSKRSYVLAASQRKTGYIHDFDQLSIVKPKIKPASQLLAFASDSSNNNNRSDLQILLNRVSTGGNNSQQIPTKNSEVEGNQEPITIQTKDNNQNEISTSKIKGPVPRLKQSTQLYQQTLQAKVHNTNTINSNTIESSAESWRLQIAIVPSQKSATELLNKVQNKVGGKLASYQLHTEPHKFRNGKQHFKAQFVGISSKIDVYAACNELKKAKFGCLVIKTN